MHAAAAGALQLLSFREDAPGAIPGNAVRERCQSPFLQILCWVGESYTIQNREHYVGHNTREASWILGRSTCSRRASCAL